MARLGERVLRRTRTDPRAAQSISAFTACLLVVLLLSLLFSAFFPFFSKYFAHTVSICLSASEVLVITLRIIQNSLPQDEPSKEVSLFLLSYGITACHLYHTYEP